MIKVTIINVVNIYLGNKYSLDIFKLSLYPNFLSTVHVVSFLPLCINKLCRYRKPLSVTQFCLTPSSRFFLKTALTSSNTCGCKGELKQRL